jgi:hypothetical protein
MRFLTGGKPTPRDVIENLPRFLDFYEHSEGFGFWAAIERSTGAFVGWVRVPPSGKRRVRRGRVRLPAREILLGQGLRNRRISRAGPQGLHRARGACSRSPWRSTSPPGALWRRQAWCKRTFHEDWPEPIEGARGGRVRADQGRLGAADQLPYETSAGSSS